jgi:hypothetical protein
MFGDASLLPPRTDQPFLFVELFYAWLKTRLESFLTQPFVHAKIAVLGSRHPPSGYYALGEDIIAS